MRDNAGWVRAWIWSGPRRAAAAFGLGLVLLAGPWGTGPAAAQQPLVPAEQQLQELLDLAEAYQTGYLQVVAVCCYQLYSTCGIVAADYTSGYIDAETALFALDESGLLHSVCTSTLSSIRAVTPAGDTVALDELDRLETMLDAEGALLSALRDVIDEPTEQRIAAVETARLKVVEALDAYTAVPEGM